jgi:hypothetical protein
MTTLFDAIETDWENEGGSAASAPLAAGIALAESGGNPSAQNLNDPNGGSFGLWQINGAHAPGGKATPSWISQIEDPGANAAEAVALSSDGTDWQPWTDDATWKQWVAAGSPPDPSAATVQSWLSAAGASTGTGAPSDALTTAAAASTSGQAGLNLNPLDGFGIGSSISSAVGDVEHFFAKALLVIAGLGLAGFGVVKMIDPNRKASGVLADAAPLVAA